MDVYAHQAKKIQEQTRQIISLDKEGESLRTQIAAQAAQIELLQSDIAHIKEVEFVRRVEKVAANWQLKLETQTIKSREQFEKLLRFMDDYCEISDSDFTEIESTVEEVLLSSTTPSQALEAFAAKVRNEAYEKAAVMLDTMESEWYDGDQFRPNLPVDCAAEIRQLKETS